MKMASCDSRPCALLTGHLCRKAFAARDNPLFLHDPLATVRAQVKTTAEACNVMQEDLMAARSREMRNEDALVKAERSTGVLAKDNHRLQTAYNEVTKATERELKQMKDLHHDHLTRFLGACLDSEPGRQQMYRVPV